MKTINLKFVLFIEIVFLCFSSNLAFSQYWENMALEKSFEKMDFFFLSNQLNPFGMGDFQQTSPGLIDNPFLNLIVNPANLDSDSSRKTHFYMDFRSIHNYETEPNYIMPFYDNQNFYNDIYFPYYYTEPHKKLIPVFSGGIIFQPLNLWGRELNFGITYQAIFQDEDYYFVPFDIYRSSIGYDYAGNEVTERTDIPIIDKYSGKDRMHHVAHFLTFYHGFRLTNNTKFGLRANRTLFSRDGAYGSHNFWESFYDYESTSLWENFENREQSYQHWDFNGGFKIKLNDKFVLGLSAGFLWGDVTQSLTNEDSSFYSYGEFGVSDDWSFYHKYGESSKHWDHDGKSSYGGFDVSYKVSDKKKVNFYYQFNQQCSKIYLSANVVDTSYSSYNYEWDEYIYTGENNYSLSDFRKGRGDRKINSHRAMGALQWKMEENKKLSFGIQIDYQLGKTNTNEHVISDRHYGGHYTSYSDTNRYNYYDGVREDKELLWDFETRLLTVQIPVIFNWQISSKVELIFGLNRKMSSWRIDDKTLALFKYKETSTVASTEREENFGERYTEPQEKRTDVRTTFLGGLVISPAKYFNIRIMAVPNFSNTYYGTELSDMQMWIALNMFP